MKKEKKKKHVLLVYKRRFERKGGGEGAQNFVPQMRFEILSIIIKLSKLKKCTHMISIYSLSLTQNWREI